MSDCNCYKCREGKACIREFRLSIHATPSRRQGRGRPREADPAWERGTAGEERPDGSFMPFVDSTGKSIGVKKYADGRSHYDKVRGELARGDRVNQVS